MALVAYAAQADYRRRVASQRVGRTMSATPRFGLKHVPLHNISNRAHRGIRR